MNTTNFLNILKKTSYTDPEFGSALIKWKPLLFNSVSKVSNATDSSYEDTFSSIMLKLVEVNHNYKSSMYFYNDTIWKKIEESKGISRLRPQSCIIDSARDVKVESSKLVRVDPCNLETSIYMKIKQKSSDILKNYLKFKKGFEHVADQFESLDSSLLSNIDNFFIDSSNVLVEDILIIRDYLDQIYSNISDSVQVVLDYLLDNPGVKDIEVSQDLGLSLKKVQYGRFEIMRNIPFLTTKPKKSSKPIYYNMDWII